jgi:ribosomal protein S18 acetylase RimI-like enzyme
MDEPDNKAYVQIARDLDVFYESELRMLGELLDQIRNKTSKNYTLFDEREGDRILGFVVFRKTPMTDHSWDIYWLVVEKDRHRKGIGKKLLKRVEEYILANDERAIIRAETSSHKDYACAVDFYRKTGFAAAGAIPDFYEKNDDLLIFYKRVPAYAPKGE